MNADQLLEECGKLLSQETSAGTRLQRVCDYLRGAVEHYSWFGFYLAVPDERLLVLGPFSGEPTEHLQIPFGSGICGQAAERGEALLVPDVTKERNYLSCSPKVQSEIVVPVSHKGVLMGEIDIDSHSRDAFTNGDERFLHRLAKEVAPVVAEVASDLAEDSGSA